jgi:hypothetical protein
LFTAVAVGIAVGANIPAALVPRMPAGGVRVLVGPPVFKTGVSSDPAQAGSIPVRLRYQAVYLSSSPSRSAHTAFWHRRWHSSTPSSCSGKASTVIRKRNGYWQVKVYAASTR